MNSSHSLWDRYQQLRRTAGICLERGSRRIRACLLSWASPSAILFALLAVALAVRLWGITSPPLEFHPARQFMGAHIARWIYINGCPEEPDWRRRVAAQNVRNENILEPHVLERMAVLGYRLMGGEALWVPRLLSISFWLAGAILLYQIGVRLSSVPSALVASSFYLFMPFTILASRSFQPDPLMICLELAAILALMRFAEQECLPRLLLAAGVCVAAVFVKPVSLSVLLGVYGVPSLRRHGLVRTLTSRYTLVLGIALSAPVAYYLRKMLWNAGDSYLAAQAGASILPALLWTCGFWRGVAVMLGRVIGIVPLLLALAGLALTEERRPHQGVLAGMWLGYGIFVLVFTYHTHTHDYYHLQLVPIAALCIGPLIMQALGAVQERPWLTGTRIALAAGLLGGLVCLGAVGLLHGRHSQGGIAGYVKPVLRTTGAAFGIPDKLIGLLRPARIGVDADAEAARAAGEAVQHSLHTVFLGTHEGTALTYLGEFSGVRWPSYGGLRARRLRGEASLSAEERLRELQRQRPDLEYFVVTDFGDLARQPDLERLLAAQPVVARGPGYAVYSLGR